MHPNVERAARSEAWAVVLAGGEGRRLASLTKALYGARVPKQFAALGGRLSLLQETLERVGALFARERTLVVVTGSHEAIARSQVEEYRGIEVVAQPRNLDTGPGVLFPLSRILARDPRARIAFFPSDHFVPRPRPFLEAVSAALHSSPPERITLLGAVPDAPETEYGWIVPGGPVDSVPAPAPLVVKAFVEKPPLALAESLLRQGALWNMFVFAADARTLWEHAEVCLPEHARRFAALAERIGDPGETALLAAEYDRMEPANFSRRFLERVDGLCVLPVAGSGWSDWGSPARVLRSLEGFPRDPSPSSRRKVEFMPTRTAAEVPPLEWRSRYQHFTPSEREIEHIEQGVATIARRVEVFPRKRLHVDVRGVPKRSLFQITVTLELPHRQLVVGDLGVRQSFPTAWRRCVKKLEHKLDAYLLRLSGRERVRPVAEAKATPRLSAESGRELERLRNGRDFAGFAEALEDLRVEIVRHVQRIQGSSPSPDLPEDEVVEAVFVLAFDAFDRRPHDLSFVDWIQGLVPRALHDLRGKRGRLLQRARALRGASPTRSSAP